ncbi:class I SAM-dependent methyltransferase [Aureibaculum sp. A20]|uniref:Class I SAM-dependent methyltransferase n=1 Tax=Aureibaculum flavum TaxID=2795986 RepID=A0ABS0WT51_9FLAO|nr:class I SAM-dependent methyltransferase [Aureibaculum flavum]MBJ2175171.1 class I SAM-dependent methyltransferase [Aureibaculum flavum]
MDLVKNNNIENTLNYLLSDSKKDKYKIIKGLAKSMFTPMQPSDFKDAYLSISKKQGEGLVQLIKSNNFKNIVEFGTSFGISTLYLAKGVIETQGHIITTELIESKAHKAIENFKKARVNTIIEVRIGDAMETLKNHRASIDLLFLDGWKDLYLPIFQMLEPNFNNNTIVYVDNANMEESLAFLKTVSQNKKYKFQTEFNGKVVLITINNK